MGVLSSLFQKKVLSAEQYSLELEEFEKEEEATEAAIGRDAATERQLQSQIAAAYTKKMELFQAQVSYFKATGATANAVRTLNVGFQKFFRKIGMQPRRALFGVSKRLLKFIGGSPDVLRTARAKLGQLQLSIQQLETDLALEKAQTNPIFQNCIEKLKVIKEQRQLLKGYLSDLGDQEKQIKNEALEAEKVFITIQAEREALKARFAELQAEINKGEEEWGEFEDES